MLKRRLQLTVLWLRDQVWPRYRVRILSAAAWSILYMGAVLIDWRAALLALLADAARWWVGVWAARKGSTGNIP